MHQNNSKLDCLIVPIMSLTPYILIPDNPCSNPHSQLDFHQSINQFNFKPINIKATIAKNKIINAIHQSK